MKKLALITALMCVASSLVMAQTNGTATSGSTVTGTSSTTTSLNGSSGMGTGAVTTAGPTGVNTGPAAAQTTGATTGQTATTGAPANPTTNAMGNAVGTTTNIAPVGQAAAGNTPPLKGANSFTKKEAAHRLVANGYTHVSGLAKDSQSIWRGTAMKNGKRVSVALDYKGNITEGTVGGGTPTQQ